jgi:hypothetical protein
VIPVETLPGMERRGIKENDKGVNLRHIVSTFVNVTMYLSTIIMTIKIKFKIISKTSLVRKKNHLGIQAQWLTPVILVTQEAEI